MVRNADVFADLVRALEPYAGEIVFVGGWVHALYLHEAEWKGPVVRTDDIDVTLPDELDARDRPQLMELIRTAGFEIEQYDDASGILEIYRGDVALDLLTEAESPSKPVAIEGQGGLVVQGYPYQDLLRRNARPILVGPEFHPSLALRREIRVPELPAYVLGKVLSSSTRTSLRKQAKDLVYVLEILRSEILRERLAADFPEFLTRNAAEGAIAGRYLPRVLGDDHLLREITSQRIEASGFGFQDDTGVRSETAAALRRFRGEMWPGRME